MALLTNICLLYLVIHYMNLSCSQVCSPSKSHSCSSQGREVVSRHKLRVLVSSNSRYLRDEPADGTVGEVLVRDGGEIIYQISLRANKRRSNL